MKLVEDCEEVPQVPELDRRGTRPALRLRRTSPNVIDLSPLQARLPVAAKRPGIAALPGVKLLDGYQPELPRVQYA